MKSPVLIICFLILNFKRTNGLKYKFDKSEYFRMPRLYKFDDYEQCMGLYKDEALYCVVNSYIKPDGTSNLYNNIMEFSSNGKQHFRHDKLKRGLCTNTCTQLIDNLGDDSEKYFVEEFPMDTKLIFDFIYYFNAEEHRAKYNKLVNKCVNLELMDVYNLTAYSSIDYCIFGDTKVPIDTLDIIFAGLLIALTISILISSLFDRYLRNTTSKMTGDSIEHYKNLPEIKAHQYLVIFSFRRNWYTLSSETKAEVRDLRFIQIIRALTLFGVVIGHTGWFCIVLPSYNPIFIEDIYSNIESMLVINGINIVQSFFVLSGFLNGYLFMTYVDKTKDTCYWMLLKSTILRYMRMIPLVVFFILVHATWLYHAGSGPIWDNINFPERQFCRENWWTNVLFINNYVSGDKKCLIHTWYLAADFYLSIIGTFLLIVMVKKPVLTKWLLSIAVGSSAVITGYVTYVLKLEPVPIFSPEYLRNQLFVASENEPNYFTTLYSPTHLNGGNYFIGMAVGLFYFQMKASKKDFRKLIWLRLIYYICVTMGFVVCMVAYVFYKNDYEKPSILLAIISTILKHSWGIIMGLGIFCALHRYGWFMVDIFNYPAFRILGRISYSAFMCHIFFLKLIMSSINQPMYLSLFNISSYVIAIYFLSNLVGLLLTLSIELPMTSLLKIMFREREKKSIDTNHPENNQKVGNNV